MEKPGGRGLGAAFGLATVLMWGTQFTVTKVLYRHLDAFAVTTVRYGVGGVVLLGILAAVEGPRALRTREHTKRAWILGPTGVVGSVLLMYTGLEHTRAQNAALIAALQPLLTALFLRLTRKGALPRSTAVAIAVAFAGSVVVIARGDPRTFVDGGIGWGVILCLLGQVAWVLYTVELSSFVGWSTLRITAVTAATGGAASAFLWGIALAAGISHPEFGKLGGGNLLLAWMVLGPTVAAVFCWNSGRRLLGAQDVAVFMYMVPVVTFVTEALRGSQPGVVEGIAAGVVVLTLLAEYVVQLRARSHTGAATGVTAGPAAAVSADAR